MNETASESSRLVAKAMDAGINYFDVAPQYGNAQEMLGPALRPYRKEVFLACKTQLRTAKEAEEDLHNSLKLLETDHFDLYQFHAVTSKEDVDTILGPDGAMETALKALKAGKIRHLGFSAHSEEAAIALLDAYRFDSVLFPLNWVTWHSGDFGKRVVSKAQEQGAALLALKALSKRKVEEEETSPWEKAWYWPVESYEEAKQGLRFTLGLPVSSAVSPGHEHLLDWAIAAAKDYSPLSSEEDAQLAEKAGNYPLIFDAHHSQWQAQQ